MTVARLAALEYMRSLVVLTEDPVGSNKTPIGKFWDVDGVPWCALSVSYVLKQVGIPLPHLTYKLKDGSWASYEHDGCWGLVSTGFNYAEAHGQLTDQPLPGHCVIYGDSDHTGLFDRWNVYGYSFWAIEGNTANSDMERDQTNGIYLTRRLRYVSWVQGFWAYPNSELELTDTPVPASGFGLNRADGSYPSVSATPENDEEDEMTPKAWRLPSGTIVLVAGGLWWTPTWLPQMKRWEDMEAAMIEAADYFGLIKRHDDGRLYRDLTDAALTTLCHANQVPEAVVDHIAQMVKAAVLESMKQAPAAPAPAV